MKTLTNYIIESIKVNHEDAFKETLPFDASQWNDWKTSKQNDDIVVYEDPKSSSLCQVYLNTKPMTHIATYDMKEQELHCNDKNIFGKEE